MKIAWPRLRIPHVPIRALVILWAISMFLAWGILVVGWHIAKRQLTGLGDQVFGNILVLSQVHDLEQAALGYTREELLWHATYGHEHQKEHGGEHHEHSAGKHQKRRDEYLRQAEQILADAGSYATNAKTREL